MKTVLINLKEDSTNFSKKNYDHETERREELLAYKKRIISILRDLNVDQNIILKIRNSLCIFDIKKIIWRRLQTNIQRELQINEVNFQISNKYKNRLRKKNKKKKSNNHFNKESLKIIYTPMGNKR